MQSQWQFQVLCILVCFAFLFFCPIYLFVTVSCELNVTLLLNRNLSHLNLNFNIIWQLHVKHDIGLTIQKKKKNIKTLSKFKIWNLKPWKLATLAIIEDVSRRWIASIFGNMRSWFCTVRPWEFTGPTRKHTVQLWIHAAQKPITLRNCFHRPFSFSSGKFVWAPVSQLGTLFW